MAHDAAEGLTNRLGDETSPYLLQHAHNPVDWYPWGEAAFEKARAEDLPILLSVGYSACHWCHVMAHESFEDPATAALMNEHFVNVKVDREERPDVDAVYMNAVQAMTGQGGWPMTVVMTPEGAPFFGGTYFPPDERHGRPSFMRVLKSLSDAWQTRRDEVTASAEAMTQHLGAMANLPSAEGELDKGILKDALTALMASYDPRHGGFGGAPKFPPHSILTFLLRRPEPAALEMAQKTLSEMARGGIYDHLGGGFARYSVDAVWLVPHFEKMLYDNAQLVSRYAEAFQKTGDPLYKRVIEETVAWAQREMLDSSGGFYSALDADSEGEEGKFYVWDEEEIDELLGDDAALAKAYFDVSDAGNFEGKNILHTPQFKEAVAQAFGLSVEAVEERLGSIRQTLFTARAARIRPGLDDKILLSWNGLMLAALADAGRILGREDYLDSARRNAAFIRDEMMQGGRLLHSYKNGEAKIAGLLEDYAFYGLGLLALYRATLEPQWLTLALELARTLTEHFTDPQGGFFSTPDDGEKLIVRPKDFFDAAVPSGNGAAAKFLLTLARFTDNREWETLAAGAVAPVAGAMRKHPVGFGTLLEALQHLLTPPKEIALFGDLKSEDTRALVNEVQKLPLPYTVVGLAEDAEDPLVDVLPFLGGRGRVEGKATAYVCEGGACKLPVTTVEGLVENLGREGGP